MPLDSSCASRLFAFVFAAALYQRPGYRRMLKIYGWLLFVLGIALTLMLLLNRPFP